MLLRALPRARAFLRGEATPGQAEECRHEGGGNSHRNEHGKGSADSHGAEEGDADNQQPEQGDDDGDAGEHDGAPRGANRDGRRFLGIFAPSKLGSVPRQDEQCVVNSDREADHQGQERGGAGDGRECRDGGDSADDDSHPDKSAEQRHAGGEEGAKGDEQHHCRKHDTEYFGDRQARGVVLKDLTTEFDGHPSITGD